VCVLRVPRGRSFSLSSRRSLVRECSLPGRGPANVGRSRASFLHVVRFENVMHLDVRLARREAVRRERQAQPVW